MANRGLLEFVHLQLPSSPLELLGLALCLGVIAVTFRRLTDLSTLVTIVVIALGAFLQTGDVAIAVVLATCGALLSVANPTRTSPPNSGFPRQAAAVLLGFVAYELARWLIAADMSKAEINANRVVSFERHMGLFFEPNLQAALSENTGVVWDFIYSQVFLATVVGSLVAIYFVDQARYRIYRNALAVSTVLALVIIVLFPVAPPRLMPNLGITDTILMEGHQRTYVNEFAAVPSLHVGWLALTGYIWSLSLHGWRRWLTMLVPGLTMFISVIVTGNHYWVDGVIGCLISVGPALLFIRLSSDRVPGRETGFRLLSRAVH